MTWLNNPESSGSQELFYFQKVWPCQHSHDILYKCIHIHIEAVAEIGIATTSRPLLKRCSGKAAWQPATCALSLGMLGCALRQRWQRSSATKSRSSPREATPTFSTSASTSTESQKNAVVNEFQCFLFFKCSESKSWLMTWRWSCRIDGTLKKLQNIDTVPFKHHRCWRR